MRIEAGELLRFVGCETRFFEFCAQDMVGDFLPPLAHEQVEPLPVEWVERMRVREDREPTEQSARSLRNHEGLLFASTNAQAMPRLERPIVTFEERPNEIAGGLFVDCSRGRVGRPALCAHFNLDTTGFFVARDQLETVPFVLALLQETEVDDLKTCSTGPVVDMLDCEAARLLAESDHPLEEERGFYGDLDVDCGESHGHDETITFLCVVSRCMIGIGTYIPSVTHVGIGQQPWIDDPRSRPPLGG